MTNQEERERFRERVTEYTQAGYQLESLEDECAVLVFVEGARPRMLMSPWWMLFLLVNRIGFSKQDHTATLRIDEHGNIHEEGFVIERVTLTSPENVRLLILLVFGLPLLILLVLLGSGLL